ncbi:MAG: o-succinylbenzoate synthase [Oligoflexia bacterium]|nr:o-succinylbenzoate synthase [Oligoflexia bacterium]
MEIRSATIYVFELPLKGSFKTAFGVIDKKQSVLVALNDAAGNVGYGEGATLPAPMYVAEYTAVAAMALRDHLLPAVVGKEFASPDDLYRAFAHVKGFQMAKTAVECAAWDLYAQAQGRPLRDILGGKAQEIEVGESIGIKPTIDALLKEVQTRITEGYRRIKLKIEPGWEREPVAAVRGAFPNIPLMVDGNSSFTLAHIGALKALDGFNLMMMEQPLGYDDIIDHAQLQRQISTPVCLDESILSAEDARKALDIGACKIINIKPGRVGGVSESKRIHDLCVGRGVPVWCGGMLESSIGRFFNLAVASLPGFTLPADMSPSDMYFKHDLVQRPLTVEGGLAKVPDGLADYGVDIPQLVRCSREIFEVTPSGARSLTAGALDAGHSEQAAERAVERGQQPRP